MNALIGVDGCRTGWTLATSDGDLSRTRFAGERRVANRPVSGTPAEISCERQRLAWALRTAAMLLDEQAHHEAGRAVATLETASRSKRLRHRDELSSAGQRFDGVDLLIGNGPQEHQAAVDRAIRASAPFVDDEGDGAGAALALGAPSFAPVSPRARRKSSNVLRAGWSSMQTVRPFSRKRSGAGTAGFPSMPVSGETYEYRRRRSSTRSARRVLVWGRQMASLRPVPFDALVRRMFRELARQESIFDLPVRAFFTGDATRDVSVLFHRRTASTPYGPAAGPQSQLAQNIVLSWLGGGRIIELKTIQIDDELTIPRPCIDMQTVGYNVEWSQELKIEHSLEEYAKASMLIEMLIASGKLPLATEMTRTVFDVSLGYDLPGIMSPRVGAFIRGMQDASEVVARLRRSIPDEFGNYRDIAFSTHLSSTLTLSTFHGCPPGEIERIVEFLLREFGLHVIVKLNPMLLGGAETRRLLNEEMGYHDIRVPDSAFEGDTTWDQAVGLIDRLGSVAAGLGLGVGVKFTNTLIVENHRPFFPNSAEMYLSGPPLHVLAMHLVRRFRREFGDRFPISFSGGIDRVNFADAVALGLTPVTVCTDLLRPGGYGRARGYLQGLLDRMRAVGAPDVDSFVLDAFGQGDAALPLAMKGDSDTERRVRAALARGVDRRAACGAELFRRWVGEAARLNAEVYVERATADPRYHRGRNARLPRKIGRSLKLFDCITCDKCVPVCPNDANFTFVLPRGEIPIVKVRCEPAGWRHWQEGSLWIEEKHQIATYADCCNDCGNCDVFCPEDGGPYIVKPRIFGSAASWESAAALDGFFFQRADPDDMVLGRFGGRDYRMVARNGQIAFSGEGFDVAFSEADPEGTIAGTSTAVIDLTYFRIMNALRHAILSSSAVTFVTAQLA